MVRTGAVPHAREAVTLWERMRAGAAPQARAQLSTHPCVAERRTALQFWSTAALILYDGNAPGPVDPLPDSRSQEGEPAALSVGGAPP